MNDPGIPVEKQRKSRCEQKVDNNAEQRLGNENGDFPPNLLIIGLELGARYLWNRR